MEQRRRSLHELLTIDLFHVFHPGDVFREGGFDGNQQGTRRKCRGGDHFTAAHFGLELRRRSSGLVWHKGEGIADAAAEESGHGKNAGQLHDGMDCCVEKSGKEVRNLHEQEGR